MRIQPSVCQLIKQLEPAACGKGSREPVGIRYLYMRPKHDIVTNLDGADVQEAAVEVQVDATPHADVVALHTAVALRAARLSRPHAIFCCSAAQSRQSKGIRFSPLSQHGEWDATCEGPRSAMRTVPLKHTTVLLCAQNLLVRRTARNYC